MDKKRTKAYIKKLEKHKESSKEHMEYALKRLDVILIVLSSSGMLLAITYLKDHPSSELPITLSLCSFILTIVANIASQWFAYANNHYEMRWIEEEIEKEEADLKEKDFDTKSLDKYDARAIFFRRFINPINLISTLFWLIGVGLLFWGFTS